MKRTGILTYEERGGTVYARLEGDVGIENVKAIGAAFGEIFDKRPCLVGVDCGDLEAIDSSAIGALVKASRRAGEVKARFIFYDLPPAVDTILKTMSLHRFFTVMTRDEFERECGRRA